MLRSAERADSHSLVTGNGDPTARRYRLWDGLTKTQDGARIVVIGCLATLLALAGSWQVSLWTDEAATIAGARRTLPELWRMLQNVDAVHGLYYLLMHFWIELFGQSPASLRLPSALAVGAGAIGVYLLARILCGSGAALGCALIFAVLPRVTWMGVEARSFAFSAAAAVWLSVLLIRALERNTTSRWIAYSAMSATSVAINLYCVLLIASHAVALVALRNVTWSQRFRWLLSVVFGMAASAPVLFLSIRQGGQVSDQNLGWGRWLENVAVNQWFLGDTPTTHEGATRSDELWVIAAVALAGLCWLLMSFAVLRTMMFGRGASLPMWFVWIVPQVLLPTLVIGLYSLFIHPMYNPRYLSLSAPAVAILIAVGLRLLPKYWMRVAAWAMILSLATPIYLSQREASAKSGSDWLGVADYIGAHAQARDVVYFSPRYPPTEPSARLTLRRIAVAYPDAFVGLLDLTASVPGAADGTLDGSSKLLENSLGSLEGRSRIWLIRRADYPVAFARADDQKLRAEGFRSRLAWSGTLDYILEFTR